MNEARPSPRRTRFGCILLVLLMMILLVNLLPMADTTTQQEAQSEFTNQTGFAWPEKATVVSFGNGHGTIPLSSEGEFYLVFETDSDTIDKLLQAQPKAPLSDWQSGPVPAEIGFHCRFGTNGVAASSENGGPVHYSGNPELVDVLGSKDIKYCAHERCCDSLAWHNGTLLVVDPRNRKVWFSNWDF